MPTFQQKNALAGVSAATTADVATGLAGLLLVRFALTQYLYENGIYPVDRSKCDSADPYVARPRARDARPRPRPRPRRTRI